MSICRQTIFLPVVGLVDADTMKPGDLVGVNKDSYLILDTLPSEYDSRVKAMEVRKAFFASGGIAPQTGYSSPSLNNSMQHCDRFPTQALE